MYTLYVYDSVELFQQRSTNTLPLQPLFERSSILLTHQILHDQIHHNIQLHRTPSEKTTRAATHDQLLVRQSRTATFRENCLQHLGPNCTTLYLKRYKI